jgi:UDP-N-acetylmuramoylalanine--D-glutamate ligase
MKIKVTILGAGESGVGAALLAKKLGFQVFISDFGVILPHFKKELEDADIHFEEKQHSIDKILDTNWIVKSPGIPDKAPIIQALMAKNVPIISEIEFAGKYANGKMIGVTGSNGKTTTSLLIDHFLKMAGLDVILCGNVGTSLARELSKKDYAYYVVELSSFQLDDMFYFHNHIAVLTNITPDHLDRYQYNMQNYIDSKFKIIQNQTEEDFFIFWNEDPVINNKLNKKHIHANILPFGAHAVQNQGATLTAHGIHFKVEDFDFILPFEKIPLQGQHNYKNIAAAVLAALSLNIHPEQIIQALPSFKNLAHRLEEVAEIKDILYINDSKATNVDSAFYALGAQTRPIIWIMGGIDKGNEYAQVEALAQKKVKAIIALGLDNQKILDFFSHKVPHIYTSSSMQEAVDQASAIAKAGDVVLLSPCCASFDLFKNYAHRGDVFKEIVQQIADK